MENSLAGEKTIGNSISLEILTSSVKLPPLPTNGAKLMEMAQQPMEKIDIDSFARLVEMDPGLFASVLQLANSPYYAGVDKIISLRAAITRIGLTEAVNSICLYFFQKTLPEMPAIEGFSSREYWAYSWACAMANRRLGHPNLGMNLLPGELYITGLLHGIGKLMLAIHYPKEFSDCIGQARKFNQPLYKVEQDVFGTTDTLVAANIMKTWHFPANICAGVAFYQRPESAPAEYREIAGLTQLAYEIAAMSGIGSSGDGVAMDISSTFICRQTGLQVAKPDIREKLVREILDSLKERSESMTGVSPASPKEGTGKEEGDAAGSIGGEKTAAKVKAQGLFPRIRRLLIGS